MRRVTWVSVAALFGCGGGAGEPSIALRFGAEGDADDLAVVSDPALPDRPFLEATLVLDGDPLAVTLTASGNARVSFDDDTPTLAPGATIIRVYGDAASVAENDTRIQVRRGGAGGMVLAEEDLTVVSGVKIAFRGTFGFVVDNNNGYRASSTGLGFTACGGDADPLIWRATPLPCEGLSALFNLLRIEEDPAAPDRWPLAGGNRPELRVEVSGVRTFGPAIDLAGRDPALTVGTPVTSPPEWATRLVTDDCDGDPGTGDPNGLDQGVELVIDFGLRLGADLTVAYPDNQADTLGRIWTRFPAPPTPAEAAADTAAVDALFPAGNVGCATMGMVYFDENGLFQCDTSQTVQQLLARNVGFRSMIRRAWADFTTRRLVATAAAGSPVARLFADAVAGRAGGAAEAFLQLSGYDWYTLTGVIEKGVVATPGGIPAEFDAWTAAGGCPSPQEPDEAFEDDPWLTDPP